MKGRFLLGVTLAIVAVGSNALAQIAPNPCPERPVWLDMPKTVPPNDRVEISEVEGVPVAVLLPRSYATSGRRYPTVYLHHGGLSWYGEWLTLTDLIDFTAALPEEHQAIVVMPDGGAGVSTDFNPGPSAWERFHTTTLIEAIDARYRTIPDREHRAIAGISAGGFRTLFEASRHPDLFAAAGSISGWIDSGVTAPGLVWMAAADVFHGVCSDGPGGTGMRPAKDPVTGEVWFHNSNPIDLTTNIRDRSVYAGVGTGVPCSPGEVAEYGDVYIAAEPTLREQLTRYVPALADAGVEKTIEFRDCGIHSFRYFEQYLHNFWAVMVEAFDRTPPASFDYRNADQELSVWDWTFTADPSRAPEFLEIADASASGVTLTGSGVETVMTAPYFAPGEIVTLTNAVEPTVVADPDGRITFHVDLGPAHKVQQYTLPARALELLGNYWTTRTVMFS